MTSYSSTGGASQDRLPLLSLTVKTRQWRMAKISNPDIVSSFEFVKYNVEVEVPEFTDEDYDSHLRSDDWSREETDYLLELVKDYYYRWAVIWDRYDYQPSAKSHLSAQDAMNGDSTALATLPFAPPKTRTVEDLKARFYDIQAKLMKLPHPRSPNGRRPIRAL